MSEAKRPWRGSRLTYRIDDGIVEIFGDDEFSMREWEGVVRAVAADPSYRPGMGILRDRRSTPPPSTAFIRFIVSTLESSPELATTRWAIVVSEPASYGMVRMAELLARVPRIRAFESIEEARAWLRDGG